MGKVTVVGGKVGMNVPVVPIKGIELSTIAEGSIVKVNESGKPVEFYVAKHDYEPTLNSNGRTLLVRKYCYDKRQWHTSEVNDYSASAIDTWLNSTYKGLLDADSKSAIGDTWFYCTKGNSTSVTTLNRSVFLLSVTELGKTASWAKKEGSALPIASTLQVAYYNGNAVYQWTRSRDIDDTTAACVLDTNGEVDSAFCDNPYDQTYCSRPCFTLPSTAVFDEETLVFKGA